VILIIGGDLMKVKVRVFGYLKKYLLSDSGKIELEIEQQTNLAELLQLLGIPENELEFNLLLVNGSNVNKDEKLKEGDIVSLVQLVGGG
jgi:sulfur carrier protein ThiS